MSKKYHLHDGKSGTALPVRVIPRARSNEIVEIMNDGAIKIRLKCKSDIKDVNKTLVKYLATILGVSTSNIEVVAGEAKQSKLVSVLNLDSVTAHERVLAGMS